MRQGARGGRRCARTLPALSVCRRVPGGSRPPAGPGDEALAQGLAAAARSAEPDVRLGPSRHGVSQMRATSRRLSRALTSTSQPHPRRLRIALQAGDEALVGFGRAVEQIDLAPVGLHRERLHAGDEG